MSGASKEICTICQSSINEDIMECHAEGDGHKFCKSCLLQWLMHKNTCPSCGSRKCISNLDYALLTKQDELLLPLNFDIRDEEKEKFEEASENPSLYLAKITCGKCKNFQWTISRVPWSVNVAYKNGWKYSKKDKEDYCPTCKSRGGKKRTKRRKRRKKRTRKRSRKSRKRRRKL